METQELKSQFGILRGTFFMLLASQLLFLIICSVVVFTNAYHVSQTTENIFLYLVPIISLGSLLAGFIVYSYRHKMKDPSAQPEERLRKYMIHSILKLAFFEGAAFMCMLAFLVTGELIYFYSTLLIMFIYVISIPRFKKFEAELSLNE